MRHLYRDIVESHIELSRKQQRAIRKRVMQLANRERLATLLNMLPGLLAILIFPWLSRRLTGLPTAWQVATELLVALGSLGVVYFVFRYRYRKYAVRAIVELGFADLCLK